MYRPSEPLGLGEPAGIAASAHGEPSAPQSLATLAAIFAPGILHKGLALRSLALTAPQRARIRESVGVDIRKLCDMAPPAVRPPEISLAAARMASALSVDLGRETWQSQPRFDPGRKVFHYEHVTPVSVLVERTTAAVTVEEIIQVLESSLRLAWITKNEDARLTQLGFRHKRSDPDAAYAAAGIALV